MSTLPALPFKVRYEDYLSALMIAHATLTAALNDHSCPFTPAPAPLFSVTFLLKEIYEHERPFFCEPT